MDNPRKLGRNNFIFIMVADCSCIILNLNLCHQSYSVRIPVIIA